MAFQHDITSISDPQFQEHADYLYDGPLDEFSEEGILIARATDSLIFSSSTTASSVEASTSTEEVSTPTSLNPDSPSTPTSTSSDASSGSHSSSSTNPSDSDDLNPPFQAHPLFLAAGQAQGFQPEILHPLEEQFREQLNLLMFNRAVFSLKELESFWKKTPDLASFLHHSSWTTLRPVLFSVLELVSLDDSEPSDWTPATLLAHAPFMRMEDEMIALAQATTDAHVIPQELIDSVLASKPTMAEEQRIAAIASCTGSQCVVVTEGTAGAGKSFTLNAIREVYEKVPPPADQPDAPEGYDIIGTALSWTATKVLEESAGLSGGRAIQGLTMAMDEARDKGGDFFKRRTILIVDEAGLVGVKHMHKILWHAAHSRHPVRVLLTGDSLQLCPVEAGNALEAIVDACGSSRLDTIRRQKQASHRAAVKHFCYGRAEHGLWTYWQQEAIHFSANADERRELVMRDYVRYCVSNPQDIALVLALENAEVKRLNTEIRDRLKLVGRLLGREYPMTVTDGRGAYQASFCVGDQIVLRKNKVDHPVYPSAFQKIFNGAAAAHHQGAYQRSSTRFSQLIQQWRLDRQQSSGTEVEPLREGIFNRTTGLILDIRKKPDHPEALLIRILLSEGGEIDIDTSSYIDDKTNAVPLHHNFATTIYASQGQTVQKVLIMDSPYMNRRLAYVGMSRHTMMCDIYADCEELNARLTQHHQRYLDQAWKKFEKDTLNNKSTDQLRLAKLKQMISEWTPTPEHQSAAHYLQLMALSWNVDSANPTVRIMRQSLNRQKEVIQSGREVGYPALCLDDDPDDHLSPRLPEPFLFEDLQSAVPASAAAPSFFTKLKNVAPPSVAPDTVLQPVVLHDHRESAELPSWMTEGLGALAAEQTRGRYWDYNRYGYPRFFSLDPVHHKPCSRWGLDGSLKAGSGEPSVLLNHDHPEASWMVVAGPREALLSYTHYRHLHKDHPEKVPHIVMAPPACSLQHLRRWIPSDQTPVFHCTWSPRHPDSISLAYQHQEQLTALGFASMIYPPDPASQPQTSSRSMKP